MLPGLAFHRSRIPVAVMDVATHRFVGCNAAAAEIYGFSSPEEVLGKAPQELSAPVQGDGTESAEGVRLFVERTLAEGVAVFEWRHRRPDGTPWDAEVHLASVESDGRRLLQFTLQDITWRKEAEALLRQERIFNEAILNSIPGMLYLYDGQTRLVRWNRQHEEMTGYSAAELGGMSGLDFFGGREPDTSRVRDAILSLWGTGRVSSVEADLVKKDGTHLPCYFTGINVTIAGNEYFTGIGIDVSERKLSEERIRGLHEELRLHASSLEQSVATRTAELQSANRELEAFSYSVSHDLRAPLRAIDGFASMLEEREAGRLDAESRRLLDVIRVNTSRMGELIDALMTLSRLGRAEIRKDSVDMKAMVLDVYGEVAGAAGAAKKIDLRVGELPPGSGDPALLRQVWVNLLSNAVKYSSRRERPEIEVGTREEAGRPAWFVRDNGTGFDPKYTEKLFVAFQRVHAASEFPGLGVGLAVVSRIVARHGGSVGAEGRKGEGALFWFSL